MDNNAANDEQKDIRDDLVSRANAEIQAALHWAQQLQLYRQRQMQNIRYVEDQGQPHGCNAAEQQEYPSNSDAVHRRRMGPVMDQLVDEKNHKTMPGED